MPGGAVGGGRGGRVKIVVGLGNPGKEYERTPHNAGFMLIDALAAKHACGLRGSWRFRARTGTVHLGDERVLLVKPETFMNRSGEAVAAILRWQKATPADLMVVLDDADLPLGRLRIRASGSSGGHRGLASIVACLGTEAFARLRLGIGRGGADGRPLVNFVLGALPEADGQLLSAGVGLAVDAVTCWVTQSLDAAMNGFNGRTGAA